VKICAIIFFDNVYKSEEMKVQSKHVPVKEDNKPQAAGEIWMKEINAYKTCRFCDERVDGYLCQLFHSCNIITYTDIDKK